MDNSDRNPTRIAWCGYVSMQRFDLGRKLKPQVSWEWQTQRQAVMSGVRLPPRIDGWWLFLEYGVLRRPWKANPAQRRVCRSATATIHQGMLRYGAVPLGPSLNQVDLRSC